MINGQAAPKPGSAEWMEVCYDRTNEKLWRYVYSILRNEADTYDIVQNAYLRLIIAFPSLKKLSDKEIDSYLTVIARNLALKCYAGRKRIVPSDKLDCLIGKKNMETAIEEREIRSQQKRALHKALKRLSENHRELIIMKYYRGYGNEKIADKLHIKPESVRMAHTRALRSIQQFIWENPHI